MKRVVLSAHDIAIWHTVDICMHIDAGLLHRRPRLATSFPTSPDDVALAAGPFSLHALAAPGDGTYTRDSGFFLATGKGGLAITAGVMAGRAMMNSRRRREAEARATPRWMPIDGGEVVTSLLGFYLRTTDGRLLPWQWGAISAADVIAPRMMHFNADTTGGPVSWILESDWAELAFVLWCRQRHPHHPQYQSSSWVPDQWAKRMSDAGQSLPSRPHPALGDDR